MAFNSTQSSEYAPTSSAEFVPGPGSASSTSARPDSAPTRGTRSSARRPNSSRPGSAQSMNDENAYPPGVAPPGGVSLAAAASKAALASKRNAHPAVAPAVGLSARGAAAVTAPRVGLRTSSRASNSIWASRPGMSVVEVLGGAAGPGASAQELAVHPPAAKRRVVSGSSASTAGSAANSRRSVRPLGRPASSVSQMKGMGVVRTGPAVVAHRSSPSTSAVRLDQPTSSTSSTSSNAGPQLSLSSSTGQQLLPAASLAAPRVPKRSLEPSSDDDRSPAGGNNDSPLKRRVLPPTSVQSPSKVSSGPFDLTSPRKAALAGAVLSPARGQGAMVVRLGELPTRLTHSPLRNASTQSASAIFGGAGLKSPIKLLKQEESAMLVDEEEFTPISPELAVLRDESSDEDEIDWLSPKKAATGPLKGVALVPVEDAFVLDSPTKLGRTSAPPRELGMRMLSPTTAPSKTGLRSPPPKRMLLAAGAAALPTSVPMERTPAALAASAALSLLPPPTRAREERMSIDPSLLSQPPRTVTPAPSTTSTALVSKRGLAPAPTTQRAPSFLSSPAPAHRAHPSPAPGSAFKTKSGIPRLVPPTPAVIPPTPVGGWASARKSATPAMPSPSAATATAGAPATAAKGAPGSATSETAARLQNLQAMLSRLAGPRPQTVGASTSTSAAERRTSLTGYTNNAGAGAAKHTGARTPLTRRPSTAPAAASTSASANGDSVVPLAPEGASAPAPASRRTSLTNSARGTDAPAAAGAVDKSSVLRGVVAFVDVRTGEGDDAGMLFVSMLKDMGARVATRPVPSLTHIIFKAGRPSTLQRAKFPPQGCAAPHLVGIGWVVQCAERAERVEEAPFAVTDEQQILDTGLGVPGLGLAAKRRRSMEPKALVSLADRGASIGQNAGLKATIAASIERARLRSLQFAPKVGSPLSKRVMSMTLEDLDKPQESGEELAEQQQPKEAEAEAEDVVMA